MKAVLDPCCGGRAMWFDKADPRAVFGDRRYETLTVTDRSHRDDGTCTLFDRWLREYPAQKLPMLRKLGLRPDACISASLLDSPTSQLSVAAVSRPT